MIDILLNIALAALSIWDSKLKQKYIDLVMGLKQQYYDEYNKPIGVRSDAVLDNLEFQLKNAVAALAADIRLQGK